jgi:hypothetical protein
MSQPAPELERIQRFLDGGSDAISRRARRNWTALEANAWADEITRLVAAPSWARPLARREHARCVEMAVERTSTSPESRTVEILPIWTGDNRDSDPGPHWYATHAVVDDAELEAPWETSPVVLDAADRFDRRLAVDVQCWRVAHLVQVSSYAPSVELVFRGKHYGVLDGELYTVVSALPLQGDALPRPTHDVPMFCQWFEPRVDGVKTKLLEALRARSFTAGAEERSFD